MSKTGFDKNQFLRNNGFNTVIPTNNKKLVTVYKNIISNENLTPYDPVKTNQLGVTKEQEINPCKLDQNNKDNILTCEL